MKAIFGWLMAVAVVICKVYHEGLIIIKAGQTVTPALLLCLVGEQSARRNWVKVTCPLCVNAIFRATQIDAA